MPAEFCMLSCMLFGMHEVVRLHEDGCGTNRNLDLKYATIWPTYPKS
jgi:hypothetical protein